MIAAAARAALTGARPHRWRIAAVAVAGLAVVVAKHAYSGAGADDLGWILAPTAGLVSLVTGGNFVHEAGAGWVDRDLAYVIAPACSGVNFALAGFLALMLAWLPRVSSAARAAGALAAAAVVALAVTLAVNAARIALAIALHRGAIDLGGLDPAEVHRAEGIAVYLGGLCGLYAVARRAGAPDGGRSRGASPLAWIAAPLAAYVVVTLLMPLANGAAARPGFGHHAAWVVGGALAAAAIAGLVAAARGPLAGERNNPPPLGVEAPGGGA